MKNLFLITFLALAFGIKAQSIAVKPGSTAIRIIQDGTIKQHGVTKGYVKPDGTLENASHATIGYIKSDGTIENASHSTVGYVKGDGTVENATHTAIGYIKSDYTVENVSHSTIGHGEGYSIYWVAVASFFFNP